MVIRVGQGQLDFQRTISCGVSFNRGSLAAQQPASKRLAHPGKLAGANRFAPFSGAYAENCGRSARLMKR